MTLHNDITVKNLLIAGLTGEILFEIYAWLISPMLFNQTLEPANLVMALAKKILGLEIAYTMAFAIHFMIGAFAFVIALYLMNLLLKGRLIWSGLATGLSLWFLAQGILAPFIGRPFMMNFNAYTQSSFIGHVGMCLIIAFMLKAMTQNTARPT